MQSFWESLCFLVASPLNSLSTHLWSLRTFIYDSHSKGRFWRVLTSRHEHCGVRLWKSAACAGYSGPKNVQQCSRWSSQFMNWEWPYSRPLSMTNNKQAIAEITECFIVSALHAWRCNFGQMIVDQEFKRKDNALFSVRVDTYFLSVELRTNNLTICSKSRWFPAVSETKLWIPLCLQRNNIWLTRPLESFSDYFQKVLQGLFYLKQCEKAQFLQPIQLSGC